jgi:predicted ArsR family transcriptional regulator
MYICGVTVADLERQIAAIALLHDPIRRGLYRYVVQRHGDVGRDEAARAVRVSRALAAFHLDKLVREGLLEATYRRLTGRRGPGAGRPAKLYRRSDRQLDVTVPQRRYELAGRIFARALTAAAPSARSWLDRAARAEGRSLGAQARRRAGPDAGTDAVLEAAVTLLEEWGFEPARVNGEIRMRNCPFDTLANECRPLVCGMALALVRSALTAAGARGTRVEIRPPEAGSCCVILKTPPSAPAKR